MRKLGSANLLRALLAPIGLSSAERPNPCVAPSYRLRSTPVHRLVLKMGIKNLPLNVPRYDGHAMGREPIWVNGRARAGCNEIR
jgi:hypothetical protein